MKESYIQPFPPSVAHRPVSQEASLTGVEPAPRDLVSDIIINTTARDMLPREFQYLASTEYILANITLTVPTETASKHILTPTSFGRSVPIASGCIPFGTEVNTHIGHILTGKGSWVAGKIRRYVDEGILAYGQHTGLLSLDGARDDTRASNILLESGFRSALHLGYAVFNATRLQKWIKKRWPTDNHHEVIEDSFAKVKAGGGPAYLFRLGGSLERVHDISDLHKPHRLYAETRQSAQLFLKESAIPNSHISTALRLCRRPKLSIEALTHLRDGRSLHSEEFTEYANLLAATWALNTKALQHAVSILPLAGIYIGQEKDIDLGLFSYDFDEAIETAYRYPNQQDNIQKYVQVAAKGLSRLLTDIAPKYFFPSGYREGALISITSPSYERIMRYIPG